jgi:hypothetical protein
MARAPAAGALAARPLRRRNGEQAAPQHGSTGQATAPRGASLHVYPAGASTSSAPRATSGKNGLATSPMTRPTVFVRRLTRLRATWLGRNPRRAITRSTRARVAAAREFSPLITRDTVWCETRATRATSRMVGRFSGGRAAIVASSVRTPQPARGLTVRGLDVTG